MKPQLQDRITVEKGGDQLEVFNWVNVDQFSIARGNNPVVSTEDTQIGAGDSSMHPDAVTKWVAEELDANFHIDPTDHGIDVVDVESDEVTVL